MADMRRHSPLRTQGKSGLSFVSSESGMDIESSLIPKIAVGLVSLYALKRRLAKRKTDGKARAIFAWKV